MSKQEFGLVLVIIAPVLISMKTVPGAISSAVLILIGFMLMTSKVNYPTVEHSTKIAKVEYKHDRGL